MEQERVFNKCWLYLCHESEVEKPGDYRRRDVAGRPLLFIRGSDGKLRVFLNTWTYRGALICRHDQGHAEDKILKGAKPADLPVQQATKFEFVVGNSRLPKLVSVLLSSLSATDGICSVKLP